MYLLVSDTENIFKFRNGNEYVKDFKNNKKKQLHVHMKQLLLIKIRYWPLFFFELSLNSS